MKFFVKIIAVLIFSATSAFACDGYYMGLRGGIVNHNIGETGASNGNRFKVDDNALMLAGALGYRYGNFRGEFEYTFREEYATSHPLLGSSAFQTESYMANVFYDLKPYSRFTPFIMAGLGFTNVTSSFEGGGTAPEYYEETNFTWSAGGGLSAKLTNRWNLDIGYRFYNMGKLEEASIRTHEVYGGARYIF